MKLIEALLYLLGLGVTAIVGLCFGVVGWILTGVSLLCMLCIIAMGLGQICDTLRRR